MTEFTRVTDDILARARKLQESGARTINSVVVAVQATIEAGLNGRITLDQYHLLILADADLLDLERSTPASAESQMKYLPFQHPSTPCLLRAFALIQGHDFAGAKAQFEEALGRSLEQSEPLKNSDPKVREYMRIASVIELEQERIQAIEMRRAAQAYLFEEEAV